MLLPNNQEGRGECFINHQTYDISNDDQIMFDTFTTLNDIENPSRESIYDTSSTIPCNLDINNVLHNERQQSQFLGPQLGCSMSSAYNGPAYSMSTQKINKATPGYRSSFSSLSAKISSDEHISYSTTPAIDINIRGPSRSNKTNSGNRSAPYPERPRNSENRPTSCRIPTSSRSSIRQVSTPPDAEIYQESIWTWMSNKDESISLWDSNGEEYTIPPPSPLPQETNTHTRWYMEVNPIGGLRVVNMYGDLHITPAASNQQVMLGSSTLIHPCFSLRDEIPLIQTRCSETNQVSDLQPSQQAEFEPATHTPHVTYFDQPHELKSPVPKTVVRHLSQLNYDTRTREYAPNEGPYAPIKFNKGCTPKLSRVPVQLQLHYLEWEMDKRRESEPVPNTIDGRRAKIALMDRHCQYAFAKRIAGWENQREKDARSDLAKVRKETNQKIRDVMHKYPLPRGPRRGDSSGSRILSQNEASRMAEIQLAEQAAQERINAIHELYSLPVENDVRQQENSQFSQSRTKSQIQEDTVFQVEGDGQPIAERTQRKATFSDIYGSSVSSRIQKVNSNHFVGLDLSDRAGDTRDPVCQVADVVAISLQGNITGFAYQTGNERRVTEVMRVDTPHTDNRAELKNSEVHEDVGRAMEEEDTDIDSLFDSNLKSPAYDS